MPLHLTRRRTWTIIAAAAVTALLVTAGVIWWNRAPQVTIGVEGRQTIVIPGPRLHAAPFTPGDALAVRMADVTPTKSGYRYDLRYMAFGPGKYDLRGWLVLEGNERPQGLPKLTILVDSILPKDHQGELFSTGVSALELHTSYRLMMGVLWSLWALLLIPLVFYGRPSKTGPVLPPHAPTTGERLRMLLERAERGSLSPEQQADLERLLVAFWSQRLNLSSERLPALISHLRQHPAAGRQMALVETWLHGRHSPPDGAPATARTLLNDLAPDLNAPAN